MKSRWVLFHLGKLILDSFHTSNAILQSYKAWTDDSFPPHATHLSLTVTFLLAKQWFVGNISLQVRHRKCLILLGHSSFQINFHRFVILDAYEQFSQAFVPFFSFSMLSATLYALFTINSLLIVMPIFSSCQEGSGWLVSWERPQLHVEEKYSSPFCSPKCHYLGPKDPLPFPPLYVGFLDWLHWRTWRLEAIYPSKCPHFCHYLYTISYLFPRCIWLPVDFSTCMMTSFLARLPESLCFQNILLLKPCEWVKMDFGQYATLVWLVMLNWKPWDS